jgi:hypothetical protein
VITANKGFDREQMWPIGEGRRLNTTLRCVEQDAKSAFQNCLTGNWHGTGEPLSAYR